MGGGEDGESLRASYHQAARKEPNGHQLVKYRSCMPIILSTYSIFEALESQQIGSGVGWPTALVCRGKLYLF